MARHYGQNLRRRTVQIPFLADIPRRLAALPRSAKRAVLVLNDAVMLSAALWSALALKSDRVDPGISEPALWVVGSVLVGVMVFAKLGLYRAVIRFIAPKAVSAVALGVLSSVLALGLTSWLAGLAPLPFSLLVIFYTLAFLFVAGSRFVARMMFLHAGGRRGAGRVLIYGAGSAGAQLASSLMASPDCIPICFVDDNPGLWGSAVCGLDVFAPHRIQGLVETYGIDRILLALPSASRFRRNEILRSLTTAGVRVQSVPDISSILDGSARVVQVHDIDPADLLGRDPVPPNKALMSACIDGKCVLVTGAGGSIGSELCRQIIRQNPSRLLLLEMSEAALYGVEHELTLIKNREKLPVEIVSLLGNAHHKYRVREILATFEVQTIYHAAAYKHVPIVEHNIVEGIHNNVFSTWHTAEAAVECGVDVFVLVSTDKAVNPTNVMGATKRFAEIVLQGLQLRGCKTRFCMVRFGNVLDSSGSVVPLFRRQIEAGGPVTVTHPDVTRYFMTIPEASQLVLQASAMAKGGDVFVLDMGEPIRIADLARRMIQVSGHTVRDVDNPDGDIEIRFTGLRPAEKLYEELLIGNNVTGTEHPMIMRAVEHSLPWPEVVAQLEAIGAAIRRFDCRAVVDLLSATVREYQPSKEIQDLVWSRRRELAGPAVADGKVADLVARRARQPGQNAP
jgi:FlaA1/EpsC-like NDP-sugar epimerase